jgi:phosphatidylethanolamine-binding protein (PEBP) family uncharacterized protein
MRYFFLGLAVIVGAFVAQGADAMKRVLTSRVLQQRDEIPSLCTCDGADRSPPLAWSGVPAGTKRLALVFDDPDAPRRSDGLLAGGSRGSRRYTRLAPGRNRLARGCKHPQWITC